MFDLAWSEIALIGVVALVAIGPKDMPVALKAVTDMIKKARRMAAEFQTHVDDMVKDANLSEVRDQFNELRTMDIKGKILNAVDSDHTLRRTIVDDPFKVPPATTATTIPGLADAAPIAGDPLPDVPAPPLVSAADTPAVVAAPAFIPPSEVPAPIPLPPAPPAFIPPDAAQHRA